MDMKKRLLMLALVLCMALPAAYAADPAHDDRTAMTRLQYADAA